MHSGLHHRPQTAGFAACPAPGFSIPAAVRSILAALLLSAAPGQAQIFADVAVSQGSAPLGSFRILLAHDKAPRTCANFIGLATGRRPWIRETSSRLVENTPYYNGRIFHRLIHNFMIQGGSSDGLGSAGCGYVIQDEFHPELRHSGRYMVSMAKTNLPGTGGSQFFITLQAAAHLDDKHSVFGEVVSGKEIIDAFASPALFPTNPSDRPLTEIRIDSVSVSGPSLAGFDLHAESLELPGFEAVACLPQRNAAAGSFTVTFDREAQHNYLYAYSPELSAWTPFRHILSVDAGGAYPFKLNGVSFNRFFASVQAIDYSFLINPTPASIPAGSSLRFQTRGGNTLTLVPNGSGGGTWSYSAGGSGTLSGFNLTDAAPSAGDFVSTSNQSHFIPLLNLQFTLSAPGGPANRAYHSMTLDFQSSNSGWSDGYGATTSSTADRVNFLHAFSVSTP